jgi:hypothetical protein
MVPVKAPRNDSGYASAFPRRDTPELCKNDLPQKVRAWGMPGARRTRSLVCKVESTRVSHHGHTGSPGIPARNGFNGFLRALPGDRAFLSPSPANFCVSGPTGPTSLFANLNASVEASGPHDFAVRRKRFRQRRSQRPSHPVPTFVTIAKRPSEGRDGVKYGFDLG